MNRPFDVVGFDIDETFTPSISWQMMTEGMGASVERLLELYEALKQGKLTLTVAQELLVKEWQRSGNAKKTFLAKLFNRHAIYPESVPTVKYLINRGYRLVIISGGVDLYVETIADRLGIKEHYANTTLHWDGDDLVGMDYELDQAGKKLTQLKVYLKRIGVTKDKCVFVGDSDNDQAVMEYTKHGVLVKTPTYTREMEQVAWKVIDSIGELPKLL
jgi:HAD superfamily phosphoserine phosphatase-like hydrolase